MTIPKREGAASVEPAGGKPRKRLGQTGVEHHRILKEGSPQ
jgi:hypothetical protein